MRIDTRLGLCSAYSLLYGVRRQTELLDRVAADGAKTVSICDFNNIYGVHSFLEAAGERQLRPVIGAALTAGETTAPAVYCFVENRGGFARLCEILTARKKDEKKFDPLPLLREDPCGLVLASADSGMLRELAGRVKKLYAAVTPDDLSALGNGLPIPPAFLDTAVFLDKSDYAVHRVLRAIGLNKTVGNLGPGEALNEGDGLFRTSEELHARLKSWPAAYRGTEEIAAACQFSGIFDGFIFPGYGENPGIELRRRVYEGADLRYGELGDMETERIEYELGIIEEKGFSPYFLRMDDIVKMAENPMSALIPGLNRTCGRGSGAASIVSYSLGITNVDPIAHDLYFERFLNPSRPDPPDIDVDFAWDERDDLIKSVIKKFGPEYCARVANHNFFRPRSALRETAKAYGFSDAQISALERRVFDLGEKPGNTGTRDTPELWDEIYGIAARIEGLPRGLGMHCGGLVITAQPINRLAPIEKSLEGYPLLAWEKEGTEAAGFVKIDLLGNRSLAVIRDTLINLGEQDVFINPYSWRPAEDSATVEALARGDSIGVFYIESPAMRQLQKKTGRGDFDHIVIHSSLIRPAANRFINEYVRRLKGGTWKHLHPRLEKILDETYGILCYQEDVSKTAVALAGFNEADADKLRKVIAKKAGSAKLAVYEKQFFEGCRKNKVDEDTIQKIWEMMLSFDGYSFCKPHSASYAMVSFQSAFLRVHYPAQFMAAVISNQGGFYRPGAYVSECRRMRLVMEGPDVNLSRWKYYGTGDEQSGSGEKFFRGKVIIGFMSIKGLSAGGAKRIIMEREKSGEYRNLEDFIRRVRPSRDDIVALCPAGVFDSIAKDNNGAALSRQMQARRLLMAPGGTAHPGQDDLFAAAQINTQSCSSGSAVFRPPAVNRGNSAHANNDLWEEYKALGFLKTHHPLILWKDQIAAIKRIKAVHISENVGRYVRLIGWPVTSKEVWTRDGQTMSFLSLEDETALYETVVFPQVYERYHKLLFDQIPLLVWGKVADDNGAVIVELQKIERIRESVPAPANPVKLLMYMMSN